MNGDTPAICKFFLRGILIGTCAVFFQVDASEADDCNFARTNVEAYKQNCSGIDGCINTDRLEALVADECGSSKIAPPKPSPAPTPSIALSTQDIAGLQAALSLLGYRVGKADGAIGPATKQAVSDFQRENGLPVTGELDERTVAALIAKAREQQVAKNQPACEALTKLKGVDFEKEWRLAVERVKIFSDVEQDIENIRDQLVDDANWTVSTWREGATYLAQTTKTTANLIGNLLQFNPATGAVASVGRTTKRRWDTVKQAIDQGQNIYLLISEQLDQAVFEILLGLLTERNTTAKITKTIYDFSNDIYDLAKMPADIANARQEVVDQLNHLEYQLRDIRNKLMVSQRWMEIQRELIAGAEAACSEERVKIDLP